MVDSDLVQKQLSTNTNPRWIGLGVTDSNTIMIWSIENLNKKGSYMDGTKEHFLYNKNILPYIYI